MVSKLLSVPCMALAACLSGFSASAPAAELFTQGACNQSGICQVFLDNFPTSLPVTRSFSFTVPGPGAVQVTLHGAMQCTNNNGTSDNQRGVIDLASQILTDSSSVPNPVGPGGNHIAMRLPPASSAAEFSAAINLHSTRVITYPGGGQKRVHFKFHRTRMDPNTSCSVFNAVFSVLYVP